MGSRALVVVKEVSSSSLPKNHYLPIFNTNTQSPQLLHLRPEKRNFQRVFSAGTTSGPSSLDVPRLAQTARISLTPQEVEEFAPKIGQVMEWFGQLQSVDLQSVEPSIRAAADTEGDHFRDDVPEIFENREAIIAAIPTYEEPYIRVPKVLNKE